MLIHGQGEYIDEWEGINVGPGQHVVISLSKKQVCLRDHLDPRNLFYVEVEM